MKRALLLLAALAAFAGFGYTPVAYTNSFTRDGVTYVQRGALGTKEYVVTNVDAQTVGRVQSVNGKTGTVVLGADDVGALTNTTTHLSGDVPTTRKVNGKALTNDIVLNATDVNARPDDWTPNASQVGALPDNQAQLEANTNFKNAVEAVSPPVVLPEKWALANVTNASGQAVGAADVNALPSGTTHVSGDVPTSRKVNGKTLDADITISASDIGAISKSGTTYGTFPIKIVDDTEDSSASVLMNYGTLKYTDDEGRYVSLYPSGFDYKLSGSAKVSRFWSDLSFESDYNAVPTPNSTRAVTSGGIYSWVSGNFLGSTSAANTYLSKSDAATSYLSKTEANEDYLKKTDASTTYLTQANAASTYLTQANAATTYLTKTEGTVYRAKNDLNVYSSEWNIESLVSQYCPTQAGLWKYRVSVMSPAPYSLLVEFANPSSSQYELLGLSAETYPSQEAANAATLFVIAEIFETMFSGLRNRTALKGGISGTLATSSDLNGLVPATRKVNNKTLGSDITLGVGDISGAVPNTRKINGQTLTQDITIEGMTEDAVIYTNNVLKTKGGVVVEVDGMDYPAMTNTVNEVKAKFYDQPLQVEWTVRMVNGDMKLYATTNVNTSVLNN